MPRPPAVGTSRSQQTNLHEDDTDRAEAVAADLHARLAPETVVVTPGRLGAIGYTAAGTFWRLGSIAEQLEKTGTLSG